MHVTESCVGPGNEASLSVCRCHLNLYYWYVLIVCVAYVTNLIPRLMYKSGNEAAYGGLHIVYVTGQDS